MRFTVIGLVAVTLLGLDAEAQRREASDFPCEEATVGGDANKRYIRMGPKKKRRPRRGYGLLIMIPGHGAGSDECWNTYRHSCGKDYVAVQLIPPRWKKGQRIIWPTKSAPVNRLAFSTEAFVEEVVDDVRAWKKIDPRHIFVMAWDTGGPAAYAISLQDKKSPTGYFIAMSMFPAKNLKAAKGQAYYIYHSTGDLICPFDQALDATKRLTDKGAKVELITYPGGHIWSDFFYSRFGKAIKWLEKNHAKPSKKARRASSSAATKA